MTECRLKVIHVIERVSQDNHGIIEAALSTAEILRGEYGIHSELWFPEDGSESHPFELRRAELVSLGTQPKVSELIESRAIDPANTVIVTHGCWRMPTALGATFRKAGFPWVYVPHGMLEPWSLGQKAFKKQIY